MATDPKQIKAVRKVLYEHYRLRRIVDHLASIEVLMNLDPTRPLPPGDLQVRAGSGPNWFIRATGNLSFFVIESADRLDKMAGLLLEMRSELAHVDFNSADKQHLRAALAAQASALKARAKVWRAPAPPQNVEAAVAPITAHVRASLREFAHVKQYLKDVNLESLR